MRCFDFGGRSRLLEYWMFQLLVLAIIGFVIIAASNSDESELSAGLLNVLLIVGVLLVLPSIAVSVRRFHDQDRSGAWLLLSLVPYVGPIILFFFMLLPGTEGTNRFGPDPLQGEREDKVGPWDEKKSERIFFASAAIALVASCGFVALIFAFG